jgi:hypothetical protein
MLLKTKTFWKSQLWLFASGKFLPTRFRFGQLFMLSWISGAELLSIAIFHL